MSDEEHYSNIRDIDQLGRFIGLRLVDITQHDKDEWDETHEAYVYLHFEDGRSLRFVIDDHGFEVEALDDDPPQIAPPTEDGA